jgi:hypothetical protein
MPIANESTVERIKNATLELKQQASEHTLWSFLTTRQALATFVESHVFAVWDFMVLLKALQSQLTGGVVWKPVGNPKARRFINEIVLGEETDELDDGRVLSHLEMYMLAMDELGANRETLGRFLDAITFLQSQDAILDAARMLGVPKESIEFMKTTLEIVENGMIHEQLSAFAIGREDAIPAMFLNVLEGLKENGSEHKMFDEYLHRHIDLDGDHHGPMGLNLVAMNCIDEEHVEEIIETASRCFRARIALWDGIQSRILANE